VVVGGYRARKCAGALDSRWIITTSFSWCFQCMSERYVAM